MQKEQRDRKETEKRREGRILWGRSQIPRSDTNDGCQPSSNVVVYYYIRWRLLLIDLTTWAPPAALPAFILSCLLPPSHPASSHPTACSLGKTLPGIHPWKISSQAAVGWEKGYCRRSQRSQGLRAGHTGRFRWLPRSAIPLPVSPAPLPLALPTLFLVISWAHSREEPGNFPTSLEPPRLRLAWEREPRRLQISDNEGKG